MLVVQSSPLFAAEVEVGRQAASGGSCYAPDDLCDGIARTLRRQCSYGDVASGRAPIVTAMTEREAKEVEKILLHISDARSRTRRAADAIEKDGGAKHVIVALRTSEKQLADLHRTLSQSTYYAVPDDGLRLAV